MNPAASQTNPYTTEDGRRPSLLTSWKWWIGPAVLCLALSIWFLDPFAGDWDSLDYTVLALKGSPSTMILGRMLFIFSNRALYWVSHALFGLRPESAYLLFKYTVLVESPLALIAWWWLSRELTGSEKSATAAALLIALSPFYIVYSGQAMTEIPSLLLLAIGLSVHTLGLKSRRLWQVLAGGLIVGLAVNIREGVILFGPWLALSPFVFGWKFGKREILLTLSCCAIFLGAAFLPFGIWYLLNPDNYRWSWQKWVELTKVESAQHPVSLANFKILLRFFFIAGPMILVAFPVAAYKEVRARRFSPLMLLGLIGIAANVSLVMHYSAVLNGRYMLTGLPAMAPLVGDYFVREQSSKFKSARAFANVVLGILFVGAVSINEAWPIGADYLRDRSRSKDYIKVLSQIPKDGVIIPGSQTVGVTYWRGIGAGQWDVISSGEAWPGAKLQESIDWYLGHDRRVFIDTDKRWWQPCGWQIAEIRDLAAIEGHYKFKRIQNDLFEVVRNDDSIGGDNPNLERLLPENRPDDVRICPR